METKHEEHFYKGLFFGVLLGVGVALFSQTKTGKEVVKRVKERASEVFSESLEDDQTEDDPEVEIVDLKPKSRARRSPRRFFKNRTAKKPAKTPLAD